MCLLRKCSKRMLQYVECQMVAFQVFLGHFGEVWAAGTTAFKLQA